MKFLSRCIVALAALVACSTQLSATVYSTPKQEMRSAWVATVWRLDWPQTVITSTGNTAQIEAQKKEMITLLDSMAANNMNAINFQVRSRADAMYKSSYEPWSEDLVAKRGMDPGYDPLAFVVEECHKRGLECHAWINPYRYESQIGQWNDDPTNYRTNHPDWLLDVGEASILNPGKEEVIKRITDICREIVTNYDVDGILYDDYFYLQGTTNSQDADLYNAYKAAGGTLSQADWRRNNVNRMVKSVYNMIQEVKPWVRFGISPAGVACTSGSVASKYGISPCPSGSDWQYNGIYSDPVAWLNDHSIDFISPQIYWTIGNSTDYSKIAPWWSEVANKFGRHFYSSHSITTLTSSSKAPATGMENSLISLKASGPNNTSFSEYANEIELNRTSSLNGAPGSIFYSCKYLYRIGTKESFAHFLKRTTFSCKAIVPAMAWKKGNNPGAIKNLSCTGKVLSWDAYDNVRYTVYAIPTYIENANFEKNAEYLLGFTYNNSFELPDDKLVGYKYAVCVLDRVGNEYSPSFYEATSSLNLDAPTLLTPADGATVLDPFELKWSAVKNATVYDVQFARDAAMNDIVKSIRTTSTTLSSAAFIDFVDNDVKIYWRVNACAQGYNDGVSAVSSFIPQILSVLYPTNGAAGVNPSFTATWNLSDGVNNALLEIATDADFTNVVFSGESTTGSIDIPAYTLHCITTYYIRVKMNGEYSRTNTFTTDALVADVPSFVCPASDGAIVSPDDHLAVAPQQAINKVVIEVSTSATSWGRTRYVENLPDYSFVSAIKASEIKTGGALLTAGKTYYARARAVYLDAESNALYTEYSEPVSFVYNSDEGAVDGISSACEARLITGAAPRVIIEAPVGAFVSVKAVTMLGTVSNVLYEGSECATEVSLADLNAGVHIITVTIDGSVHTFKFVK